MNLKDYMNDETLINGLLNEESMAFKYVYSKYKPMIIKLMQGFKLSNDQVDDIFQDGLIILIKNLRNGKFSRQAKVSTYFYGICRNLVFQKSSKKTETTLSSDSEFLLDQVQEEVSEMDGLIEKENQFAQLESAMQKISEECRKIFQGFYYQRKSMNELAEELGYTSSFIRVKKNRCMNHLKKLVHE